MKTTKRLIALAMSAVMSCTALTATVNAAWVNSDKGVMWQNADGTYAKSKWITMKNGNKYYIKSNGTRATGLLSIKNKQSGKDYYYFDEKGVMQIGWQNVKGNVYYFTVDGKAATTTQVIGDYSYKFDKNGVWDGKVYSKDGKKDVTSKVNIKELVPAATTDRSAEYGKVKTITGKKPATVMINGLTYRTDADNYKKNVFPEGNNYTDNYINIANCTDADLESLKYMSNIEVLTLVTYTNTEMKNPNAKSVTFGNNIALISNITNLDFCYYMPNLEYITIYNAPYLTDISGLSACKNLQEIKIWNCGIKNLNGLEKLTKIKKFTARSTRLENLDGLKNCINLQEVYVSLSYLTDIRGLENKTKLKKVTFNVNRRLTDISPLATCTRLETVNTQECNWVMDWSSLLQMESLKLINMRYASKNSNAKEVHDKLQAKGIQYGIYDSLIYDDSKEELPHDYMTAQLNKYWDLEKVTYNVYSNNYPCKCSYCIGLDKIGNWLGREDVPQALKDLGTYRE